LIFGAGHAEDGEATSLLSSTPLIDGGFMTEGERAPQANAENGGVTPENKIAGKRHSPGEGPMQLKLPTDAASLEQTKRALRRTQVSMLPLQPKEFQRLEDARWARQDPDVLAKYAGEFVVPYERKIVAHGKDAAVVLADASQITGRPVEELPLVGVVDPLLDMPR
jgi:hypothetical protein